MLAGMGGSRNYRVEGGGGVASLNDVLVALFLLLTECSN